MNSINLIGRLTREPDSRNTPNGTAVCTMRVAIDRPSDGADYVNVTAFGKLAKSCQQYLGKDRQISVQGRLSHSEWQSKDGERRERHEVVANTVEFLGQRLTQSAPVEPHAAHSA